MAGGCVTGAKKENVLTQTAERVRLRAGDCTVTVLPNSGQNRLHLRERPRAFAGAAGWRASRTRTMAFDSSDASGWDECLPSVAACRVKTEAGVAEIPDHGDLWRVEWEKAGLGNRERKAGNREQGIGNRWFRCVGMFLFATGS